MLKEMMDLILQLNPVQDASIYQGFPDESYGSSISLFIGQYSGMFTVFRTLLKFELPSILNDVTINSAKLKLYVYRKDASGVQPAEIYQYNQDFDESVTWNEAQTASKTLIKTINISDTGHLDIDVLDIITSWLNDTSLCRCIEIYGVEDSNALIGFRSSEYTDLNMIPVIEIDYSDASTTIDSITSGNYNIKTGNTILLGQKFSTTFGIENKGDLNSGLAIAQISDYTTVPPSVQWMDDDVVEVAPGERKVLTTIAARKADRVTIISTKIRSLCKAIDSTASPPTSWDYDMKGNLIVNTNEDVATENYSNQTALQWNQDSADTFNIDDEGVIHVQSSDISSENPKSAEIQTTTKNIDTLSYIPFDLDLIDINDATNLDAYLLSYKIANIDGIVSSSDIMVDTTVTPIEAIFRTQYTTFTSSDANVKVDGYIETDESMAGLKANVYYHDGTTTTYSLIASNVDLGTVGVSDKKIYISQISPSGLIALGAQSGKTDYFKFEITRNSGVATDYNMVQRDIAGPVDASTGLIDDNKEKILAENSESLTV